MKNQNSKRGVRLRDMFSQECVLVVTEYAIMSADVREDEDFYVVKEANSTTLRKLLESEELSYIADEIIRSGAEGEEDGIVHIYEGNVTSAVKTELCTIYVPEYWQ